MITELLLGLCLCRTGRETLKAAYYADFHAVYEVRLDAELLTRDHNITSLIQKDWEGFRRILDTAKPCEAVRDFEPRLLFRTTVAPEIEVDQRGYVRRGKTNTRLTKEKMFDLKCFLYAKFPRLILDDK